MTKTFDAARPSSQLGEPDMRYQRIFGLTSTALCCDDQRGIYRCMKAVGKSRAIAGGADEVGGATSDGPLETGRFHRARYRLSIMQGARAGWRIPNTGPCRAGEICEAVVGAWTSAVSTIPAATSRSPTR